jgi:membrane-bound lytic murein transglycosylase D
MSQSSSGYCPMPGSPLLTARDSSNLDEGSRSKGKLPMMASRHALVAFSCLVVVSAASASAQTITSSEQSLPPEISATVRGAAAGIPVPDPGAVVPRPLDAGDETELESRSIVIPRNRQVLGYIDQFSTSRKKFIEDALTRGSKYLPMIVAIFKSEGLPDDLVYLPVIESAFRTSALSHAGASGIWQMMRVTATVNGLSRDWYVDERLDPEKSTRAAAKLLKTLYGMFGDWNLALAAYNGGASRVQKAMKRSRRESFWDIAAGGPRYLPRETREYVPLFLASLEVARNPLLYGLNLNSLSEPLYDVVALAQPVDLRRIAGWLGTTVDAIRELNPELRRWTTPVRAAEYLLKVPAGMGEMLEAQLAQSIPSDLAEHIVKKGETLAVIARKLQVTRADLAEANYLSSTAPLAPGDRLIVPRQPEALRPAATTTLATRTAVATGSGSLLDAPGLSRLVHLVRPGDTLDSIARAYRTSSEAVREWNGILAESLLPGQEITIFASSW